MVGIPVKSYSRVLLLTVNKRLGVVRRREGTWMYVPPYVKVCFSRVSCLLGLPMDQILGKSCRPCQALQPRVPKTKEQWEEGRYCARVLYFVGELRKSVAAQRNTVSARKCANTGVRMVVLLFFITFFRPFFSVSSSLTTVWRSAGYSSRDDLHTYAFLFSSNCSVEVFTQSGFVPFFF